MAGIAAVLFDGRVRNRTTPLNNGDSGSIIQRQQFDKAKINQFDAARGRQFDVAGFDVTVQNWLWQRMQIDECIGNFIDPSTMRKSSPGT